MASAKVIRVKANDAGFKSLLNLLVPPLSMKEHKGQMGRIGIIGGSEVFTGAPYFSASAALRFGGDLAYVFSAKQAVTAIKTYSPEIMVTPFYDDDNIDADTGGSNKCVFQNSDNESERAQYTDYMNTAQVMSNTIIASLPRLHSLVIGPGLGRKEQVWQSVLNVITHMRTQKSQTTHSVQGSQIHGLGNALPLVIDADALYMLAQGSHLLSIRDYAGQCVLTPNSMEFSLLIKAAIRLVRQGAFDVEIDDSGTDTCTRIGGVGAADTCADTIASRDVILLALNSEFTDIRLRALAGILRLTILLKGPVDLICCGSEWKYTASDFALKGVEEKIDTKERTSAPLIATDAVTATATFNLNQDVYEIVEMGSPRRCGGQGDVLGGCVGVALHWAQSRVDMYEKLTVNIEDTDKSSSKVRPMPAVLASILASMVTRRASQYAFQDKRRAMSTTDILHTIGTAFECIVDESFHAGADHEDYDEEY